MDKYYVGYDENGEAEVFASDDPKYGTPEYSGYDAVDGPYDTKQEAEESYECY